MSRTEPKAYRAYHLCSSVFIVVALQFILSPYLLYLL